MSEDVSRFLSQVKELGERRIEEDEARSRELEEKILQDRKERQARRAERARSISPQKSSPANTPPPSTKQTETERLRLEASPALDPPSTSAQGEDHDQDMAAAGALPISTSPSKENESPLDAEIKAGLPASPTRSGTARGLSWQRRPNSQASERSRSRPLSMVAAENAARSSTATPNTDANDNLTRDQIASALSSKDPAWFRQTAERGTGSAAYRRNQVEDTQTMDMSSLRTQLPGMSRTTSDDSGAEDATRASASAMRNTIASSIPKLEPPKSDVVSDADPASPETRGLTSPPLGRTSPTRSERPISPTKGMGGFVQSAMMKRSDSVNKRWSVQQPAGLQRADSVASNRNSYITSNRYSGDSKTKPAGGLRNTSTELSRPGSSARKDEDAAAPKTIPPPLDTSVSSEPQKQDAAEPMSPPVSPSKTMDPRRWSPQKSSWLESALNKPESPKPKPAPAPSNQPAWMAELQKAKAQKATNSSGEGNKSPTISHKHQVSIGGLMRTPALGVNTAAAPSPRAGLHKSTSSISSTKEPSTPIIPTLKPAKSEPLKEAEAVDKVPPAIRPKPETPPKSDFRANLKSRAPPPGSSTGTQQAEFKNVFGNLRKTTTQNYVAPDELKNNITRGKAALNITGGPQKTERKDEFKEAILAKKKEFQTVQAEGHGVTRNNSISADQPIPEGLLKRTELGRSNTTKRGSVSSEVTGSDARRPSIQSNRDSILEDPDWHTPVEKRGSIPDLSSSQRSRPSSATSTTATKELPSFRPTAAVDLSAKETSAPGRIPGKIGNSALANRFNPALAGILARGPPASTSGPGSSSTTTSLSASKPNESVETNDNEAGSGPKLTHMTKGRARGPKRKAPTASSATTPVIKEEPARERTASQDDLPTRKPETTPLEASNRSTPPLDSSTKRFEPLARPKPEPITLVGSSEPIAEPSPPTEVTRIPITGNTAPQIHEQVAAFAAKRQLPTPYKKADDQPQSPAQSPSPNKFDTDRLSRFKGISESTDKAASSEKPKSPGPIPQANKSSFDQAARQDRSPKPQPPSPFNKPKSLMPEPLSLKPKQDPAKEDAVSTPTKSSVRTGTPLGARPLPIPIPSASNGGGSSSSMAPTVVKQEPSARPLPSPAAKPSEPPVSPLRSPTKQAADISVTLKDFFGSDRPKRDYKVDAAEILMQRPNQAAPQIQTISSQMFQFSAEGRKLPVPAHHERTLFEREMYLCAHTFKNEAGKKTSSVYFWAGDEVPEAIVEDAAIFVAREARTLGGTLVKMRQGKESPEFIQALGGVIITQRGSGNKYDSLAPHMLCGRRYQGHVVFDEVDFTPSALCSGFPYLLTHAGRCYLWKGKGSGVDELSCARLIGMDYALTGEMQEFEDGREPATFWDLFGGANRFGSADHWRLKPNYDKYCSRLFLSDAASKQQIVELPQFVQTDLQSTHIYVIDAFFELYIVVGSQAQPQYASFHNALEFAQEYAILAAGMEDRPFVPISTVVLEGIPRDMKSVFRKWQDSRSPTVTNTANAGLKRGRSLKVVTLNQALQALSD